MLANCLSAVIQILDFVITAQLLCRLQQSRQLLSHQSFQRQWLPKCLRQRNHPRWQAMQPAKGQHMCTSQQANCSQASPLQRGGLVKQGRALQAAGANRNLHLQQRDLLTARRSISRMQTMQLQNLQNLARRYCMTQQQWLRRLHQLCLWALQMTRLRACRGRVLHAVKALTQALCQVSQTESLTHHTCHHCIPALWQYSNGFDGLRFWYR